MKLIFFMPIFILSVSATFAQTPSELKSKLPVLDGWLIDDKVEVFDPENLFDRINGAAPLFIENNFREMTSMEYTKGDDYITVQAYRHATPEDAFGMYASERSSELQFYPIGGEAQGDSENIYFFAYNIYVKVSSNSSENIGNVLQTFAKEYSNNIAPGGNYPVLLNLFPTENKIEHTEGYITSGYIGHEFLKGVYTTDYRRGNQKFQAFLIDALTQTKAKEILDKYLTFAKQSTDVEEGAININDRYNGKIPVYWNNRYIMGIFSEDGQSIDNADGFLKEFDNIISEIIVVISDM